MPDVKTLLNSIIHGTNAEKPSDDTTTMIAGRSVSCAPCFDSKAYKEKLSFYVLKDIICAMMHDDTKDLDCMIDDSIMHHIHHDYDGTCFGYLNQARDRLNSPLLGSVIQEIEEAANEAEAKVKQTHENINPEDLDEMSVKEIIKNNPDYTDLREKIKNKTSEKVVREVTNVIKKSNDAPVFDNLDEKVKKKQDEKLEKQLNESFLFNICSKIVTEAAVKGSPISTEEGLERAIVEYCINEMDHLFRARPRISIRAKYKF